ncbi:hypothetical protein BOTBODRAFT_177231 [Botryobasidium botryosum FD-172 SS1]|uniref:Uncharacterized protein n=1 Tax=Botryobasidium botryosum (strain FD-172 SS1) TaxID=930990 RepID=A0A067M760_BOTB1|nr:hypothetical protein BOTBODRAFT_177231 [Botryobasidium botryosum FD-172 SS1]
MPKARKSHSASNHALLPSAPLPVKRTRNPTEKGQHGIDAANLKSLNAKNNHEKAATKSADATSRVAPAHIQEELRALKEQLAKLHGELEVTQASKEAALKRGNRYKIMVQKHIKTRDDNKSGSIADGSVPHPSGRLCLQADMGLQGKDLLYDAIYDTVIDVLRNSGADRARYWMKQPLELRVEIQARKHEPFLSQFAGDWATQGIVSQHLCNCIGHLHRKHNPNSNYNLKRLLRGAIGRRGKHARPSTAHHTNIDNATEQDEEMGEVQRNEIGKDQDEEMTGEDQDGARSDQMDEDVDEQGPQQDDRNEEEDGEGKGDEEDEDESMRSQSDDYEMSSVLSELDRPIDVD